MRNTSGVQLLAAAAFALMAAGAPAQPVAGPGSGDGTGPDGRAQRRNAGMARELGLSETQQQKLREIMDARRPQREALFARISANRDALHQLLESGSADANAVGELVLEGRKLHEQSRALREAQHKAIREALTPEQQKRFDSMQERRRERRPRAGRWPDTGGRGGPGTKGPRPPFAGGDPGERPPRP